MEGSNGQEPTVVPYLCPFRSVLLLHQRHSSNSTSLLLTLLDYNLPFHHFATHFRVFP